MTLRSRTAIALTAVALAGPTVLAQPAEAASWTTVQDTHGSKLQGCKVKLEKGWKVNARLVNASGHGHQAGVNVTRDGKIVDRAYFKVIKRRTSKVRSVVVRPGDVLSAGMADADNTGGGGGGTFSPTSLKTC